MRLTADALPKTIDNGLLPVIICSLPFFLSCSNKEAPVPSTTLIHESPVNLKYKLPESLGVTVDFSAAWVTGLFFAGIHSPSFSSF